MSLHTTSQAGAVATAAASSAGSKRKSRTEVSPARPSSSAAASALPLLSEDDEANPAAASASSSAPSSASALSAAALDPHLSAPVVKRTKRAEQSAQTAETRVLAPPMLRLLGRDSGACQSLMQMLPVCDLASLLSSHRLWLAELPASVCREPLEIGGDSLSSFGRCRWIQRSVQALQVTYASALEFDQFLRCMPQLSRLQSLVISDCSRAVSAQLLRDGFSAVAATLTDLDLILLDWTDSAVVGLWSAIGVLTGLVSLDVALGRNSGAADFAILPAMHRLERLRFDMSEGQGISSERVEALAQCKALTDLRCGQWLPSGWLTGSQEEMLTHQALIRSRFALFVQRRAENGAAPLRRLHLGDRAVIDPIGWQSLAQCTQLESIEASWSSALTEADWTRLADFQHLRALTIEDALIFEGPQRLPPLDLGRVLPPLAHCRALRSLTLTGTSKPCSLRTEHVALIARIPSLESLSCHLLRIESLDPLTAAPALTELTFSDCAGLDGEPINIRELVPSMPLVRKLTIHDYPRLQLSLAQLELCNAALLQRLPSFTQLNGSVVRRDL